MDGREIEGFRNHCEGYTISRCYLHLNGGGSTRLPFELPISLPHQLGLLLLLALPISCISWTVTHEEVFREPRDYCKQKSENSKAIVPRKFFYLFTCEYCFSHYVTALVLVLVRFQLLYAGWRGYVLAWFALVWIANFYMSAFNRLRLDIKHENVSIAVEQTTLPPDQKK